MDSQNIENHIQTFYKRNNLNIPEAEKKIYFDKEGEIEINKNEDKVSKQFELFKGYLATSKIKESTGDRVMQIIPSESDPRNLRFVEARPIKSENLERKLRNIDDLISEQKIKGNVNTQYVEYFKKDDLIRSQSVCSKEEEISYNDNERERLLNQGYKFASDAAYPQVFNVDYLNHDYNPEPEVPEVKEVKQAEDFKTKDHEETLREPPTKQNFVIHQVKPNDTIEKVCLMYGVNKDVIRMANDFLGEEIYMFKELIIPYTYGRIYQPQVEKESDEETKKKFAIECLNKIFQENYKNQKDFKHEARYYLESNNFKLDKAIAEFEADMEFERQVVKQNKEFKKKQKKRKSGFFGLFRKS